jgi:thiamine-phosphate pyrophosphorylase
VSTHCLAQARQAVTDGADYLGCGPAFASSTKQFDQYPGLALLRAVRREISLPAFAIGGISERNLPQVLETGFRRIAVSAAVIQAEDPSTAARRLLEMLHGAPGDGL